MKTTVKKTEKEFKNKTNFLVGDFLIRIKNAALANLREINMPLTKNVKNVAEAMKKSGFLDEIKTHDKVLTVKLAIKSKKPVLRDLKIVSKPGLRVYSEVSELEKRRKPSIYIISTSKGVLSSKEAIKARVGGEIIAEVLK